MTAQPQTSTCRRQAGAESLRPAARRAEAAEFSELRFPRLRSGQSWPPPSPFSTEVPGRLRTPSHGGSRGLGDVHRAEPPEVAGSCCSEEEAQRPPRRAEGRAASWGQRCRAPCPRTLGGCNLEVIPGLDIKVPFVSVKPLLLWSSNFP